MPKPVAKKWIRNPSDLEAIKQGCYFDEAEGKRYCDFIERFCRLSQDRWEGKLIVLQLWQRDFIMRLFGWRTKLDKRRFRRAFLLVAKKNGKSTLLSCIVLALTLIDNAGGPQIYLNACDREQARIVYEECARMVKASPELDARLTTLDSRNRIVWEAGNGVIIANSASVDAKDGRNASAVVFDELHRQPNRLLWDIFKYAGLARDQFLLLSITTAGEEEDGIWHEQLEYSEGVNAGTVHDITHLGVVYRPKKDADLDDPETWKAANPSLGVTLDETTFKLELEEAKQVPINLNNFKRLRLNIVARASEKFFNLENWASSACNFIHKDRKLSLADLKGRPVYIGLDLASINDFCAMVVLAGTEERGYKLITYFWCPEARLMDLERETKMPYRMWEEHGYLIATPGQTTDYAFIRKAINELNDKACIDKGLVDPAHAVQLCNQLIEHDGLPIEFIRQGFISLTDPTKQFKRLIDSGLIEHDANPVMLWCLSNAIGETDAADNVKLSKKKSRLKIDGAAAGVNSVAAASGTDSGESVYETRGLLSI